MLLQLYKNYKFQQENYFKMNNYAKLNIYKFINNYNKNDLYYYIPLYNCNVFLVVKLIINSLLILHIII